MSGFLGWIFRMPLIARWSTMFSFRREDIAQHSHQVAVVCHLLAVISNKRFGTNLDPGKAALVGLYHDISEVMLSDCPSPTKYMSEEMTREYKRLERHAETICLGQLPEQIRDEFEGLIASEKIAPEYKRIAKAADVYCGLIKAKAELKMHNYEYEEVKQKLQLHLKELSKEVPALEYLEQMFTGKTLATLDSLSRAA